MKQEHRAIIQRAKKDGLNPMELASELLCHDLLQACIDQLNKHETPFKRLGEQQQDSVIQAMQDEINKAVDVATQVINANGAEVVQFKLKSMKIDTKLTVTGTVDGDDPNRHVLTDKAHDKSNILLVLYPNDYYQGLDAIQGEKDQKDLPLDDAGDKPRKGKATKAGDIANSLAEPKPKPELPPALIDQAEEFVRKFQTATHAGIQNHLKISFDKADALLEALEARGVITAPDAQGNRQLVRETKATLAEHASASDGSDDLAIPTEITAEIYEAAQAKVIGDQKVSRGALAIAFDLDDTLAAELIEMLEEDGIISEESDLGTRTVLVQPETEEA
jgi:ribosomal protein S25